MQLVHHFEFSCSKNTGLSLGLIDGSIVLSDSGASVSINGMSRHEILSGINMVLAQAHYYDDTRAALEQIIATATDGIRKIDSSKKLASGELVES